MGQQAQLSRQQQQKNRGKTSGPGQAMLNSKRPTKVTVIDELKSLVSKVGGDMSQADATALIKAADKDGNMGIDFSEFAKLWEALHGEGEAKLRADFAKLDTDSSGFITKDEMAVTISSDFTGDKLESPIFIRDSRNFLNVAFL